MNKLPNWKTEHSYWLKNHIVAGVDEAGRGPLAGPVVAAAVIFSKEVNIDGLMDSKLLTQKKREKLFYEIIEKATCFSISTVGHTYIDRYNILNATHLAMRRALFSLVIQPTIVFVDGLKANIPYQQLPIVKGDSKVASIAAASILAKVQRDWLMQFYDKMYPNYGFKNHKGYPTRAHRLAITKYFISPIHRTSFKLLKDTDSLFHD